jgi:hypothetical protein
MYPVKFIDYIILKRPNGYDGWLTRESNDRIKFNQCNISRQSGLIPIRMSKDLHSGIRFPVHFISCDVMSSQENGN